MEASCAVPGVKIPTRALSKAGSEMGRKNNCIGTASADLSREDVAHVDRNLEYMTLGKNLPGHFGFETLNRCNVTCKMCHVAKKVESNGPEPYYRLTLDEVKRMLKEVPLKSVIFSGAYAEPFMNKEIFDIAKYVRSRGGTAASITNGTLIGGKFAKRIIESGFSDLWVSIHGATAETAQNIMERSKFDTVVQNLKDLQACKAEAKVSSPGVHFIFVGVKSNIRELEDLIRLAADVGALDVAVKELIRPPAVHGLDSAWWDEEDLVNHPKLLAENYQRAEQTAKQVGVRLRTDGTYRKIVDDFGKSAPEPGTQDASTAAQTSLPIYDDRKIQPPEPGETRFCMAPFNKPNIFKNVVSPCCSKSANRSRARMGFIGEDGVFPVWDNEVYRQTRIGLLTGEGLPGFCLECERAPIVPKEVMIVHLALWLHVACGQKKALETLREYKAHYSLYLETMKRLSLPLITPPKALHEELEAESASPTPPSGMSRDRWLLEDPLSV